MIELIAIDMDGTLLNPDHRISPRVKQAIAAARAKGVRIVLASGRPVSGLRRYLHELEIAGDDAYCIAFNGALVQRLGSGERIVETTLDFGDYLYCEQVARMLGVHFQAFDGSRLFTPNADISPYTVADSYLTDSPLFHRAAADMDPALRFPKLMMVDHAEVLDAALARLPQDLRERYAVMKSAPFFLEIFDHRAGKGPALRMLADHLRIAPEHIMAIGDQENDLTMLQFAHASVAMGNAIPAVKAVARHETASNRDDGVAVAIERLVLQ
jgi:Cof subfamily protein (haloacid dehalogenase superfamily)